MEGRQKSRKHGCVRLGSLEVDSKQGVEKRDRELEKANTGCISGQVTFVGDLLVKSCKGLWEMI